MFRLFKAKSLEDEVLVARFRDRNDVAALGELYQRYTHLVFGLCMKYLKNEAQTEDAVMGIFEKLIDDLKKHEVHNFKSWLYTYSKNFCLMELRKQESERKAHSGVAHEQKNMELAEQLHPDEVDEFSKEENITRLEKAIQELKNEQKVCIELFYLQKQSYAEISNHTGFEFNQVKSFIQNGKRNLKILMEKAE